MTKYAEFIFVVCSTHFAKTCVSLNVLSIKNRKLHLQKTTFSICENLQCQSVLILHSACVTCLFTEKWRPCVGSILYCTNVDYNTDISKNRFKFSLLQFKLWWKPWLSCIFLWLSSSYTVPIESIRLYWKCSCLLCCKLHTGDLSLTNYVTHTVPVHSRFELYSVWKYWI